MPELSGRVGEGQDPATRIQNVIDSGAGWIPAADASMVDQGKQDLLEKIANENWVAPYVWTIRWVNIPPQEPVQTLDVSIVSSDLL